MNPVTRRNFLKIAGAAVALVAAPIKVAKALVAPVFRADDPIEAYKVFIREHLQMYLFEYNDPVMRNCIRKVSSDFLSNYVQQGKLYDFQIVCDESNNGPEIVGKNQFVLEVFFKRNRNPNIHELRVTGGGYVLCEDQCPTNK